MKRKRHSAVEASRNQTGCLKTTLILVGTAILFIAAIILIGDLKCAHDVEDWWMPLYPNGQTVDVQYDFIRPRAWGTTTLTMTTTDDVETVKQFYRDTRLFTLKNKTKGIASGDSRVLPLEQSLAAAERHHDALLKELAEEPAEELAAEIDKQKAWLEKLRRRLQMGDVSHIVLVSVCGI